MKLPSAFVGFLVLRRAFSLSAKPPALISKALSGTNTVSIQECVDAQGCDNVIFVDATWFHKGERNGAEEFEAGPRIANARHINMDDIACQKELFPNLNPKGLGHMLPPKHLFAKTMDEMKISNDDHVIVYGKEGSFFTPRTWFLFRTMGHEEVHLMQGSFEEFRDAGGVVEDGPTKIPLAKDILEAADDRSTSYMATEPENVVNMEEMLGSLNSDEDVVVLDPRGSSFKKKGNIPGAIHLPYKKLVEPDNSLKLKSKEELLALFDEIGVEVDTDKTIITSCGSGVSVCHILLALEECGRSADKPTYMYDGSWQEYGSDPNTPKVLPQNFP